MAASSTSNTHPSSLETPHESLSLLLRLLGASFTKNEYQGMSPPDMLGGKSREGQVSELKEEGLKTLCCPSLSLKHDQEDNPFDGIQKNSSTDARSRQQVQGNAAALLAREIKSSGEEAFENTNGIVTDTSALSKIPEALLGNVYESFAILVDSRLRAYSNFLALQGVTLAQSDPSSTTPADLRALEQKIEALVLAGSKISVDSVSTHFEEIRILEDDDDDEQIASRVSLPFLFRLQMNLIVPCTSGEVERVNVSLSAPGQISGKSLSPLV
jgi:predicted peroxiredoxin